MYIYCWEEIFTFNLIFIFFVLKERDVVAPPIADPPPANSITKHSWPVLQDTNLCPQDLTPEVVWLSGAVHTAEKADE